MAFGSCTEVLSTMVKGHEAEHLSESELLNCPILAVDGMLY
ncbi:hypothetical protein I553_10398 [Mycobacterium xenopi 4042]|uniref:Uncharacterized protein n=1 Tax=Mycobacterium xenopi 4042 TaxID=1299334 RepID=X7ZIS4_MYCXE|nr:hypothetical protein I553_10398 [Mycobacterium xenopi 4042]